MFEHQQLAFPPLSQGDASLAMLWRRLWEGRDGLVAPSTGCPTRAVPSEPRAGCCPHSPGAAGARAGLQAAGAAGSVPPVSRTCRTGEYEQLSDVNQHGPNSCFSCPHSSVWAWFYWLFWTRVPRAGGWQCPLCSCSLWGTDSTRSWSLPALQGCQALCSPTGSWKLQHHVEVFR